MWSIGGSYGIIILFGQKSEWHTSLLVVAVSVFIVVVVAVDVDGEGLWGYSVCMCACEYTHAHELCVHVCVCVCVRTRAFPVLYVRQNNSISPQCTVICAPYEKFLYYFYITWSLSEGQADLWGRLISASCADSCNRHSGVKTIRDLTWI